MILYFHGGGWVTGTLDTYDASDRALANGTGAIVLSVAYRLAPEAKFPAAQDDADAAYAWLLKNAGSLGGNSRQIALAGESAGGNLAIDTAIWARDQRLQAPVHELLIYPVVGTNLETPSYKKTTQAVPLNRKVILWYVSHFTRSMTDLQDPRLNVVGKADLRGLPRPMIGGALPRGRSDAGCPHGLHQVVDHPGRNTVDAGLLDDGVSAFPTVRRGCRNDGK